MGVLGGGLNIIRGGGGKKTTNLGFFGGFFMKIGAFMVYIPFKEVNLAI